MACGCSGSTNPRQSVRREQARAPKREPVSAPPGDPGYYWTGKKKVEAPAEAAKTVTKTTAKPKVTKTTAKQSVAPPAPAAE